MPSARPCLRRTDAPVQKPGVRAPYRRRVRLVVSAIGGTAALVINLAGQVPAAPSPPMTGPQRDITCPVGAVDVRPGTDIQRVVDAHPGPTTFCLRAGVHQLSRSITPKTGNIFVGEYGAILDGTGWVTSAPDEGAFRAHNQDIDDVTIRNLVIRHMPQRGIHTYSSGWCADPTCHFSTAGADRWTIENNEIAENIVGVQVPNGGVIRHNYIHHNVGPDPFGANPQLHGGGIQSYLSRNVLFENNEISHNGIEMKAASLSPNTTFRNNFVHHNLGNGIWYDGENPGSVIENNLVEDNAGFGIFYEVSGQGVIRNNTIRRNGASGIMISLSHNVEMYGNTLEHNLHGIQYFVNCTHVGSQAGGWIGEAFYMQDLAAYDNVIVVGTQSGAFAVGINYTSCTSAQLAPYLDGSKKLRFFRNTYHVPSLTGRYWLWGEDTKSWNQWQSLGGDRDGTMAPKLPER